MADKISELRKKCGWTQESFAHRLGVSRQAISKWESAQSVPDLKNLEKMSQLFNVSTDFLIKDELDMDDLVPGRQDLETDANALRSVSLQEANDFLAYKDDSAPKIALGVALCILGFVPLSVLGSLSEVSQSGISENQAAFVGWSLLFVFVIPAVTIFIVFGLKANKFKYLTEEPIDTAYGVRGMAKERKTQLQPRLITNVAIGVALCVLALALLITSGPLAQMWGEQWQALFGVSLVLVAGAVYLFVSIGIRWGAPQVLLQEGDWHPTQRKVGKRIAPIAAVYWLAVVAIYLAYSLPTNGWERSWVIWPVAGVVFAIIYIVVEARIKAKLNQ
ncbi:MAG: helix-turn-helix transcriptional regulator [Actinomycetaceae bacterium]|nr:helix-turn-helix transcriptional regulator [Actinomycetaceae bacterium]